MEPESVAQSYFKDITVLFFGSLALAYAVESVNLHRRVALFVLSLVGTSIKWYSFSSPKISATKLSPLRAMAGLMGVTAFLSMWISNSAATSIMLPVASAIIDELERHEKEYRDKKLASKVANSAVNGKSGSSMK